MRSNHRVLRLQDVLTLSKFLWILLAITFPFFAVSWFRFSFVGYVAAPMIIMCTILGGCTIVLLHRNMILKNIVNARLLGGVVYLFFLWHLLSLTHTVYLSKALVEISKLAFGLLCMCAVVFYFPRDSKFGEYFWTLVIISTLPLVLFLIYYYAIVFQSDFLGTNLVEKHRGGRNQLSWYLALTMPYAIANFMCRYKLRPVAKIIGLLSLLVFVITWIYIGSRATWITVLCSFIVMSYDLRKLKEVFWFALIGLAGYWMLTSEMGELDARSRFIYLFDPESVPTLHSYDYRLSFLTDILGKIQESPVWGQGFMFAKNAFVYWPHNDYAAILCDLGVIGLILFFCVLAIVNFNLRQTKFSFRSSWVLLGARGSFVSVCMYSLFTDTYTTPLFWIFLGLCIVTSRGASFDLENVTKTGDYGELSQR